MSYHTIYNNNFRFSLNAVGNECMCKLLYTDVWLAQIIDAVQDQIEFTSQNPFTVEEERKKR